jgi:polyisoprenoid-binding protein YceI
LEVAQERLLTKPKLGADMSTSTSVSAIAPAGTWSVDPAHSKVGFAVKHMGIATVRGEFTEFEGALRIGDDLATAKAYGTVKVASVDTNESQRDDHLRSPDFFHAAEHPELRFESTKIEALDDEEFRITGNLTLHGVTNEIVLHADVQGTDVDPWGNERVGLEITGQLSRGEFGMKFNQALGSGNALVADKVKLTLDISAVKQA